MSNGQKGFLFLLFMAIAMIVIGIQGNLGVFFAILFCPKYVIVDETS
jgi:hypothetical protein